jgi:predicted TIM-barrel fold metal-dependent hydrolase
LDEIFDVNAAFGPLPDASNDLTVDALLALMEKHAITSACALSTLGILLDPAVGNAATRAACQQYPTLLPVATFNPCAFFGDDTAVRQLRADGFHMVRFFPEMQNWPVDYAPFSALVETLAQTGLPLAINLSLPGEITTLSRVLPNYPAPVILAGVDVDVLAEAICVIRARPNWYIETSGLLAPGALRSVVDSAGPGKLLFGTGAPNHPIASALNTLKYAGLSDEARRMVLSTNARGILNL